MASIINFQPITMFQLLKIIIIIINLTFFFFFIYIYMYDTGLPNLFGP